MTEKGLHVAAESCRHGPTLSSAMRDAENYARWILDRFAPYMNGRVLEVGPGYGTFTRFLASREGYLGVDIDPELIANARRCFPGREFVLADLTRPDFTTLVGGEGAWDTVVCVNVLEHLKDDAAAIRHLLDACRSGGHVLLFVPAFEALYTELDRLAGHLRRYTREALRRKIPGEMAELRKLEYINPVGAIGWWMQKFVRHDDLEAARVTAQVRLFDRLILPVSRLLNPLTTRFFGQSVLCAARKL